MSRSGVTKLNGKKMQITVMVLVSIDVYVMMVVAVIINIFHRQHRLFYVAK